MNEIIDMPTEEWSACFLIANGFSQTLMPITDFQHVIFDMDGTLTRSGLDFDLMRREIGIEDGQPVWEAVQQLPPPARERAEAVVCRHEARDAAACELQPYAADVVRRLRAAGKVVSLMTRNSRVSVDVFIERHEIAFDLTRARCDGVVKPAPDPVLDLCAAASVAPAATIAIGDYKYDLECANRAGAVSVLYYEHVNVRAKR